MLIVGKYVSTFDITLYNSTFLKKFSQIASSYKKEKKNTSKRTSFNKGLSIIDLRILVRYNFFKIN